MNFLEENCTLELLDEETILRCEKFDCGHNDLNDFFLNDAIKYSSELLGKTYIFTLNEKPSVITCAFTVANDSIKTIYLSQSRKNKLNREIPNPKRMRSYPAVLIGRLGVDTDFKNKKIGSELMDFIKAWFINRNNKTGCRYVLVDAYNEDVPLKYYKKNGFAELFTSEEEEKQYLGIVSSEPLRTRLLYFDLIILSK